MSEELVRRIHEVRFTPVRLRQGYDMGEVDQLLDELADAVAMDRPLRPLVDSARFTPVRMREGYEMGDVDAFLEQLVTDVESSGTAPVSTAPERPAPHAGSVIAEQRGLFSRLFRRA